MSFVTTKIIPNPHLNSSNPFHPTLTHIITTMPTPECPLCTIIAHSNKAKHHLHRNQFMRNCKIFNGANSCFYSFSCCGPSIHVK
mmetsp:Transcript_12789/g.17564  ORF Transcript_12789/g.17564 Transcript_12789/m.17564 type:complete len:85 (+) Transcript_12789:1186-1440(+)